MVGTSIAEFTTNPDVKYFDFIECLIEHSNFSFNITQSHQYLQKGVLWDLVASSLTWNNQTQTRVTSVQQQIQKLQKSLDLQPWLGWHEYEISMKLSQKEHVTRPSILCVTYQMSHKKIQLNLKTAESSKNLHLWRNTPKMQMVKMCRKIWAGLSIIW